ncbi:MAG TPA: prepilin-type N-terminal cleavage/methylation domain-containing protein [Planctomycetota bacterium]|nr:prepilin-type N-terminal cleavage/methylation domain-containing protein [Planctomycetota bacterium]
MSRFQHPASGFPPRAGPLAARSSKLEATPGITRGFTLIELLVALSIFLIVVSASYALFDGGRNLAARGEYHAHRFQAARAALRALEADLKGVFQGGPYDAGFIGKHGGTEELPLDTLEAVAFNNQPKLATPATTTLSVPPPKEFDISRVAYSIDDLDTTKEKGLVRQRTKLVPEVVTVKDPEEGLEEISPDVVGLRLRYYDGSDWLDTWDSTTSRTLPKAIEATVHVKSVFREKEEVEAFSTKIFLPVAASTSR